MMVLVTPKAMSHKVNGTMPACQTPSIDLLSSLELRDRIAAHILADAHPDTDSPERPHGVGQSDSLRSVSVPALRPFPLPRLLLRVQEDIAADGFNAHYMRIYRSQEFGYWGPVCRWLRQMATRQRGLRLLDVGCAYGSLLFYAIRLGFRAIGVDRTERYISRRLLRRYGCSFTVHDIESPSPIHRGRQRFDVILFTEVLEHLNYNPVPTLKKLGGMLSERGVLFLSSPDADAGWGSGMRDVPFTELPPYSAGQEFIDAHVKTYTAAELRELLVTSDFQARILRWRLPNRRGHLVARCRFKLLGQR